MVCTQSALKRIMAWYPSRGHYQYFKHIMTHPISCPPKTNTVAQSHPPTSPPLPKQKYTPHHKPLRQQFAKKQQKVQQTFVVQQDLCRFCRSVMLLRTPGVKARSTFYRVRSYHDSNSRPPDGPTINRHFVRTARPCIADGLV